MAFAAGFEWWTGFDQLAGADILQDCTSGSIAGTETGLRGEGLAITTPTTLLGRTGAGDVEVLGHLFARYDADGIPLRVHTGAGTGPYVQVSGGSITVHRSDGALVGTASSTWPSGAKRTLSFAFTLANTASGKVKLWLNGSVVLNLSSVQTVPTSGSTTATACELDGFGAFDDFGYRIGSGGWVDADVPIHKWVRTRVATAAGNLPNSSAAQGFTTYGSGATHLARVNETPANGDTNGVEYPSADGSIEGYFVDSLPGDVGTVWGVQQVVEARDTGAVQTSAIRLETRDAGGAHATSGATALGAGFQLVFKFHKVNPGTSAAWGSEYSTTQFEVVLTSAATAGAARVSQWANLIVGDAPVSIDLTPGFAEADAGEGAPALALELAPGSAGALASPLAPSVGEPGTTVPVVAVSTVAAPTLTFVTPPPPPPARCDHPTQPAYLAQLQQLLPRGPAWTRDPLAVLTNLLAAYAAELSCVDDRARALLRESDPRTTLELLPDWEAAFGLPDPCTGPLVSVAERRAALTQKLANQGGASPAYLEAQLAARGFPGAEIVEYRAFVAGSRAGDRLTSPQRAFRAGFGRAGDRLSNNEDWLYTFAVLAPDLSFSYFRAGSLAGERLRNWGNSPLECLVHELQPAHTFALFFYFRDLQPGAVAATLNVPAPTLS